MSFNQGDKCELAFSPATLEALEYDFANVMKELNADDNLDSFKVEYEKLHRALRRSYESETRLLAKSQELSSELSANTTKFQSALQLSQDDEKIIGSLRREIEKGWMMVNNAHDKENKTKETVQQLKKEIGHLNSLVEQGAGLTQGQERNLNNLIEEKKELMREGDNTKAKVGQMTKELKDITGKLNALRESHAEVSTDVAAKEDEYQKLFQGYEKAQKQRENLEKSIKDNICNLEKKSKESEISKDLLQQRNVEQKYLETEVQDGKEKVLAIIKRVAETQKVLNQETQVLTQLDQQSLLLKNEIPKRQSDLRKKKDELSSIEKRVETLNDQIEAQERLLPKAVHEQNVTIAKFSVYESKIDKKLQEIEGREHKLVEDERALRGKLHDKNVFINQRSEEETKCTELLGERAIEEGKNRSYDYELKALQRDNQQMRTEVGIVEIEQKKYADAAQKAVVKYNTVRETMRRSNEKIVKLKDQLSQCLKKIKTQQSMYEQMRVDRTAIKRQLNDVEVEIGNMKKTFKLMEHHRDHVKDDLGSKEKQLLVVNCEQKMLDKDYLAVEQRANKVKEDFQYVRSRGDALADEIKQLSQIVTDCDMEMQKQKIKYNNVMNERIIISAQLIRRNDELALLYEKICIHQSMLAKAESQYRELLVDVRKLRDKICEMRESLKSLFSSFSNTEQTRRQVLALHRELLYEKTKVKALDEELQNPVNIHRWRDTEGSNPKEMDNILKMQTLQKRLVSKTDECAQKERSIKQKEAEYAQLKNILSRQPGSEIIDQLNIYHKNLIKRVEQFKKMKTQLKETDAFLDEQMNFGKNSSSELADVKRKYCGLKIKNMALRRAHTLDLQAAKGINATNQFGHPFTVHFRGNERMFVGGGFLLSQ